MYCEAIGSRRPTVFCVDTANAHGALGLSERIRQPNWVNLTFHCFFSDQFTQLAAQHLAHRALRQFATELVDTGYFVGR